MKKRVEIRENILSANEKLAFENRALLDRWRTFSLNLMASPGAGKTSLIEATLKELVKKNNSSSNRWRPCLEY
jgi:hydrogenase nickel incorporation protein HypB